MKITQKITLASALLCGLLFASTGLVAAQHGTDDQTTTTTTVTATTDDSSDISGAPTNSTETETHNSTRETARKRAEAKVEAAKENAQDKKEENKQKVCEKHKQGLNNRFENAQTAGQRVKTRIDDIYTKAVAYHDSKQIQVSNWAELTATADQAKATAATAVAALSDTPTVDCTNQNVKSDLQAYRAKIRTAHDDLQAYRLSVRAVLKALQTASASTTTNTTTEGSNQ